MTRIAQRDRGQDLVEFALILPLFFLLVLGILEFGVAVFAYNSVANAAREGGVIRSATVADMEQAVIERTVGLNLTSANISATQTITQSTVAVVYNHGWISGPIIQAVGGDPQIQLRSVATMRRE
jgi:Flp pilus assembly protein TadG